MPRHKTWMNTRWNEIRSFFNAIAGLTSYFDPAKKDIYHNATIREIHCIVSKMEYIQEGKPI